MAAGALTGTTKAEDLPEDETITELTGGENPVEFLTMNAETIFGVIAGMTDRDRIEGWRRAEIEQIDSDRDVVLEALDRQEACLERGDTPPIYHPHHTRYDATTDPLVDEGDDVETADTDAEDNLESEEETETEDVQEATGEAHTEPDHDIHPDADLEPDEVLAITYDETTEYVWPTRADADEPYILREFTNGHQTYEGSIGVSEAFRLVRQGGEKKRADSVTVDAPLEAAVAGGESDE